MREIVISTRAQKKFTKVFKYIESKLSERIRKEFAVKLYNSIKVIQANPEGFPKSDVTRIIVNV